MTKLEMLNKAKTRAYNRCKKTGETICVYDCIENDGEWIYKTANIDNLSYDVICRCDTLYINNRTHDDSLQIFYERCTGDIEIVK